MLPKSAKSRSKYKSKASAGSSTSVLSSDQDVHVTSPPSHVIRSSIHNENNMTMSTSASAALRHHGRRKEEEDAIFSSFASKLSKALPAFKVVSVFQAWEGWSPMRGRLHGRCRMMKRKPVAFSSCLSTGPLFRRT